LTSILIDENVPTSIVKWLKKRGLNAIKVSEVGLRGAKDKDVALYAINNNMIVLTLDTDFAYIYYNVFKGSLTAIVVRIKPPTSANIKTIDTTLRKVKLRELEKKLAIITKRKVRIIS
jgi:predicted nuclease of predicted toxin-antitoxin system